MTEDYDYLFKCVAVGDGGCGKTAIVVRFSQNFFQEQYKLTIGVEFAIKSLEVKSHKVKLQIWDTGGQQRFQYVRPLYYKGAMGAIVVFDLTSRESFDHVAKWIEEVRSNAGSIPMLLVGNKSDLTEARKVSLDEAKGLAKDLDMFYVESSAKSGVGIGDVFGVLALLMIGDEIPPEFLATATGGGVTVPRPAAAAAKPMPSPAGGMPVTSAKPTPLPAFSPRPAASPSPAFTARPAASPSPAFTARPAPAFTARPAAAPTPSPAFTPRPAAAPTPSPAFTPRPATAPTPSPAFTPRPAAAPSPSPAFTPRPTAAPTPSPAFTPRPAAAPTLAPSAAFTPSFSPKPTTAPAPNGGMFIPKPTSPEPMMTPSAEKVAQEPNWFAPTVPKKTLDESEMEKALENTLDEVKAVAKPVVVDTSSPPLVYGENEVEKIIEEKTPEIPAVPEKFSIPEKMEIPIEKASEVKPIINAAPSAAVQPIGTNPFMAAAKQPISITPTPAQKPVSPQPLPQQPVVAEPLKAEGDDGKKKSRFASFLTAIRGKPKAEQPAEGDKMKSGLYNIFGASPGQSTPAPASAPAASAPAPFSMPFGSGGSAAKPTPASASTPSSEDLKKKNQLVCPNCGAVLNKAFKFCNKCGQRVQ